MHFELGEFADLQKRLQPITNIIQMSQYAPAAPR